MTQVHQAAHQDLYVCRDQKNMCDKQSNQSLKENCVIRLREIIYMPEGEDGTLPKRVRDTNHLNLRKGTYHQKHSFAFNPKNCEIRQLVHFFVSGFFLKNVGLNELKFGATAYVTCRLITI